MKTPLIALAASLAAITAAPVLAQPSIKIEHRDLDLATPAGQAKLDQRIENAAREVCGLNQKRTGTRTASPKDTKCFRQAKAEVKKQVAAAVAAQQLGG